MRSSFGILFSVGIKHSYYSGVCEDFDFVLPADSVKLARNGKIITRTRDGKFYALCERNESGTPRAPINGLTLRIGLRLKNPHFSNFSQMTFPQGLLPIYRNSATPVLLDGGNALQAVGTLFPHPLSKPDRPVTVTILDSNGTILRTVVLSDALNQSPLPVDFREFDPGAYSIKETYASSNKKTDYYLDTELIKQNIFGIVEIKIDPSFYTGTPPDFFIQFEAKQETLKYYVVGKNYSLVELNSITVSDAGFSEEGRPQVVFTRVNQASFTGNDLSPGLITDAQSKVVLFKSQGLVSRLHKPRKKIQLTKSADVIIKHLPQPGIEQSNSDMIIQISKP
ncbi:MAG: hypothetical protein HXX13_17535 [Bacteroidetes bacterium]|nr:hypothetical protein [Bacteroidota bacterium]